MGAELKVMLAQIEVLPGHPAENTARILTVIDQARKAGRELVVFPELAVPGYLIGDAWERPAFLRECESCGKRIAAASHGLIVIFGNVAMDWTGRNEDGRVRKYNALYVAHDGSFVRPENGAHEFVIKTLLPNYREFDDSRYFFDLRKLAIEQDCRVEELINPVVVAGHRLGCILCEDAWDGDYAVSPLRILGRKNCELFVNISCSPFTLNKNHKRNRVFSSIAQELRRPLIYLNNVGIQDNGKTVFTFDGSSCVYDGHGNQVADLAPFVDGVITCDIPLHGQAFGDPVRLQDDDIGMIHCALAYGTRKFMDRCGLKRIVIGLSGGIDSAVVAALYATIVPPESLLLVNMPSRFNSGLTRGLARTLAANLERMLVEIPIDASVGLTTDQLDGLEVCSPAGTYRTTLHLAPAVLENIQARDRSSRILAGIAAAFGGGFTCNANKSEMTVGYTTLYGDLGGYLANISDLWKGEVYALAHHLNNVVHGREVIPRGCFDVIPSAELSVDQDVTQGRGDPLIYPYHDSLFRSWVERWDRTTPEEILEWYIAGTLEDSIGYEGSVKRLFFTDEAFVADLERWWNNYQGLGVAKRIQAPPVLAFKRRAFGFDHREAQIGPGYTARYGELKGRLLK